FIAVHSPSTPYNCSNSVSRPFLTSNCHMIAIIGTFLGRIAHPIGVTRALWRICRRLMAPTNSHGRVISPHPSSPHHAVPVHPISPDHKQPHGLGGPGYHADAGRRRPEDIQEENDEEEADK